MKLSQMTNDQACEAMIRMAEPVSRMMEDESIVDLLKQVEQSKNVPMVITVGKLLPKFVAYAMKSHRADLYEIVGALAEETTENVGKMTLMKTIKILRESVDKDFIDFFKSSGNVTEIPGES